jgi:response regulator of citrate/malate metabolism
MLQMKSLIIKSSKKRTFEEIRKAILKSLDKPKTITIVSREIEASWVTTRRHLQWLVLIGKVKFKERLGRKFYYRV